MEIKRIGGIISTYQTAKTAAPKKPGAAVSAKNNTDRVEFGFGTTLAAAKAAIANDVRTGATPEELVEANGMAETGIGSAELAALIYMG